MGDVQTSLQSDLACAQVMTIMHSLDSLQTITSCICEPATLIECLDSARDCEMLYILTATATWCLQQ